MSYTKSKYFFIDKDLNMFECKEMNQTNRIAKMVKAQNETRSCILVDKTKINDENLVLDYNNGRGHFVEGKERAIEFLNKLINEKVKALYSQINELELKKVEYIEETQEEPQQEEQEEREPMTHESKYLSVHPIVGDTVKGDLIEKIVPRRIGPKRSKVYTLQLKNPKGIYKERTYFPNSKRITNYE